MKQNLQKRILLPFILFSVILTALLVIWASFFITHHFSQNELKNRTIILNSLEKTISTYYTVHSQIKAYTKTASQVDAVIQSYTVPTDLSTWILRTKTMPEGIYLNKDRYVFLFQDAQRRNRQSISFVQTIGSKRTPQYLITNLNTLLKNINLPTTEILGIIYKDPNSSRLIFNSNSLIPNKTLDKMSVLFTDFSLSSNRLPSDTNPFYLFKQSSFDPNLFYFIDNTYTSKAAVFQIVLGMIAVILLLTIGIFIMYSLIIKKMTTSIDILRSVSKKVAKGNFDEKVFIHSSDEIGELSEAFNQMVSQLKSNTDTIISQKNQSDAIIDCIPDGIIVTDFLNNLIIANKKAENIFNFTSIENYNKPIDLFIQDSSFKEHSSQLKSQTNYTSEISYSKKNQTLHFKMSSTVVTNSHKTPIGIVYLIRDITHEKHIEELREGFLRTVSHELRTPLTSVIGFIELVMHTDEGNFSEEQQSCLKTSLNEARALKILINDLLELSHMRAKQANLNRKNINIFTLVENVTKSLYPLTKEKDLQIINAIDKRSIEINADEAKLRRILVNLISNGIKFTHKGHIKVSCIDKPSYIEFCVSDTGIGLKDHEQQVIFEKFRQVDYSSTRKYEGIGLGLSIVKELVELHNGAVRVESTFGNGSNFYFTLEKKRDLTATLVS